MPKLPRNGVQVFDIEIWEEFEGHNRISAQMHEIGSSARKIMEDMSAEDGTILTLRATLNDVTWEEAQKIFDILQGHD